MTRQDLSFTTSHSSDDLPDPAQVHWLHQRCSTSPWSLESWNNSLADTYGRTELVIANQTNDVIGLAHCRIVQDEAELLQIFVDPAYRRRHLAKKMLTRHMSFFASIKLNKVFLEVNVANFGAICLYERMGFKATTLRKGYYKTKNGSFIDALQMRFDF